MDFRYVSFNPIRSIGIPFTVHVKPAHMFTSLSQIKHAQTILFPEYWQVNSLCYALKKEIFPSIPTYHLGHDKVEMTRSFQALCPQHLLKTGIYSNENISFEEVADLFGLPFVCKEIHSSSGLGVFLIESGQAFQSYVNSNATVYVQEYIPLEKDLRVVVIGEKAVAAYWRVGGKGVFHNNLSRGGEISRTNIPDTVVSTVVSLARSLGINYAGFDVAVTDYGIFLLEFNLYFGTQGIAMGTYDIGKAVYQYLESRYPGTSPQTWVNRQAPPAPEAAAIG